MFKLDPPQDDGLYIPLVGSWSAHKHHFLRRYLDIFTTGMKGRKWSGLHYIDLFAGAGIERIKDGGLDWGSPLIAAQAPNHFARLHLCEKRKNCFGALEKRLAKFAQPNAPQLILGDANEAVTEIVTELPERSLSVAFLDPYGLHLHFDTLRVLGSIDSKHVDLIVFFPDHLDALLNWKIHTEKPDSNLDRVLGTSEWRSACQAVPNHQRGEVLRRMYQRQIGTLGYQHFDVERICLPSGQPLYVLIFCSRHTLGGEFWRKIASSKPSGQRTFDFG